MKKIALILVVNATLFASTAFAEERASATLPADVAPAAAPAPNNAGPSAAVAAPAGEAGLSSRNLCSKEDPYIEYRDCVNASTRDANAKVRMG